MAIQLLSHAEQVAAHLRVALLKQRWTGKMPGVLALQDELGVNRTTVDIALQLLENEGLLVPQGVGKSRLIVLPENYTKTALRVGLLLYEKEDRKSDYIYELMHQLEERGYQPFTSERTLTELGMNVERVADFVAQTPADAWVVLAGSREVLEWFSQQSTPAFSLFGRLGSVKIAGTGPRKTPAIAAAVRQLCELGHRRIVFLCREERRKPEPGFVERTFLKELEAQGIATGTYNLPDWEDNPADFSRCLSSLFQHTPPTALFISAIELFASTQQFLLNQGIRVPQDVSIICTDPHPWFSWCQPTIAHIDYDSRVWVHNVLRWVNKVANGHDDRRQIITAAKLVMGGTIGPVPRA